MRSIIGLVASNRWEIRATDVKTVFLQDKQIEWTVYLRLPKEANTTKIWKLQKCVYCLHDASRFWYLREIEEFIKLGPYISSVHTIIFYWKENSCLL